MAESKELQVKEKQEMAPAAEQTRPGMVFTPRVDIFETDADLTLLADMPGVSSDNITIDLNEGLLAITGDVKPWEGPDESDVLVEFETGKYFRKFTLPGTIDQQKIEANLQDGVLRLRLPKAEKARPRKITVNAG
jgi:HSP20 family molecular chaperone IbpA